MTLYDAQVQNKKDRAKSRINNARESHAKWMDYFSGSTVSFHVLYKTFADSIGCQ